MKKIFILIMLICFLFPTVAMSTSIRVPNGTDILVRGDSEMKVIQHFGEPDYKKEKIVSISKRRRNSNGRYRVTTENVVESWYYTIDRWRYRIAICNGIVTRIEDLGRE